MSLQKAESGAELLARLHTRPDPKHIDPFIFSDISSSSTPSTLSCGKIIEIFGPEGVGKTELVLHCTAKACLPIESKSVQLNGLSAKVIFIDADFKFSVLRLAVILEKLIKCALSIRNSDCVKDVDRGNTIPTTESQKNVSCMDKNNPCQDRGEMCAKKMPEGFVDKNIFSGKKTNCGHSKSSILDTFELKNSDIEDIVKESLANVKVLKVKGSQQLLASLLSLESSIAEDSSYTLLVIDSISAFYFMDRLGDVETNSTGQKMAPICDALSRLVNKFHLTCLTVSSAFYSGTKLSQSKSKKARTTNCDESLKASWVDSEYLGKRWISTRSKRIVLSRREFFDTAGKLIDYNCCNQDRMSKDNVIHAYCDLTRAKKQYAFQDDFMQDL